MVWKHNKNKHIGGFMNGYCFRNRDLLLVDLLTWFDCWGWPKAGEEILGERVDDYIFDFLCLLSV